MDIISYILAKNYTNKAIQEIAKPMTYKGTVSTKEDLPLTDMKKGYVYTTSNDGAEYLWTSDSTTGTLSDYIELGSQRYTVTLDV